MTCPGNRLSVSGLGEETTQRHIRAIGTSVLVPSSRTLDDLTAQMSRAGGGRSGRTRMYYVPAGADAEHGLRNYGTPSTQATVFVQGGQVFPTLRKRVSAGRALVAVV